MPDDLRAAITAAFEGLDPPTNKVAELAAAIDNIIFWVQQLQHLPEHVEPVRLRSAREVKRTTSLAELDRIADAAEKLVAAIEAVHAPAIRALDKCGVMLESAGRPMVFALGNDGMVVERHPDLFLGPLRQLAEKARAAKDQIGEDYLAGAQTERPHNQFPTIIARAVTFHYEKIFPDRRADLPGSRGAPGLEGLLRKIFAAKGIRANHRAALRAALKQRAADSDPAAVQRVG